MEIKREMLEALEGMGYYEWQRFRDVIDSYFRVKIGEHERTLALSEKDFESMMVNHSIT